MRKKHRFRVAGHAWFPTYRRVKQIQGNRQYDQITPSAIQAIGGQVNLIRRGEMNKSRFGQ
ncbi:hypothetical protein BKG76_19450 [Mycobacteroides franklinii]|uniref:Uncharacterized protein n=1 Tax=Mycobacteroides franklinii TaxID=948102 RepID=A0A1S1L7G3_9MYCO|nr:hypothetical protein BKG76_19450 [Mycobacteroides franklinii]